ncbi:6-phosphogluconolactonase [Robiginitalea aurantiaca]|uniref:6-phosphogluconolactonase n=1 Tax=Robiginitalea aurantiaca TaxID=3056915 RepID=A0ABT7WCC0_9FLAO|nr:6-phosphogluconolactonase [Robiginitalea aurantiaca]MDM9630567.1 6-phosphogluconolactonase [Robiginitalea aurantiaca]
MELKIYNSKADVARALSEHVEIWCREEGLSSIALSGGSTPEIWFDLLAEEYLQRLPWPDLSFYWGDERCVPPDDAQSNYRMTRIHLLDKVPVNPSRIFRVRGENPPSEEAVRYSKLLDATLKEVGGIPQFDLVILGMGDDGHTASIFPHQIGLWESESHCVVAEHPESGQKRISLTGQIINNAKRVVFLVTGANKAAPLDQIINKRPGSEQLPASLVAPSSGRLLWMVDEQAARMSR